ncbi:glycosyltransferase family 2 protein [Aquimarina sp. MMG016]|uniref:glycosyltransferase family 2 protein n=1 Tax=Aquimarina sp. MMG016 TaxID=2822690 RepID=UPI001B3A3A88|nr:glycosyltransferase family 2 protein [Aquimarina sp. MMG016]MBQ4822191.1 glycosyltransferase family 2 protein [Aquimarina sp. MMG016]
MQIKLSIVMPCLNEAETLAICINKAKSFLELNNIVGEIIVADNGSTDGSIEIAQNLGVKIVHISIKGYGSALRGGIEAAVGEYIIIGDSDDSHDLENLNLFVEKLDEGYELVVGNRFLGGVDKKSMSFLHRYVGNPILTFIGKMLFNSKIGDFHCGLRGFARDAYKGLSLTTTGMEFASELIVKAELEKLKITEVPTKVFPSGRSREAHLRTWRDGWRHLRFLLLYSPRWLFLIPGMILFLFGIICSIILIVTPFDQNSDFLNLRTLLYASGMSLVGFQFILFYALTKIFAVSNGLLPRSQRYGSIFKVINLERGLLIGFTLILIGIMVYLYTNFTIVYDGAVTFSALDQKSTVISVGAFLFGTQIILSSFFFSILGLNDKEN